ncbi:hypothetical protein COCVIDRAFT_101085, partial [Bipolaris victoriae FI3]
LAGGGAALWRAKVGVLEKGGKKVQVALVNVQQVGVVQSKFRTRGGLWSNR